MSSVSMTVPVTTRPLHQRFGLEVRGLDLREVDRTGIDGIRREIDRTRPEVMSMTPLEKPRQCGVAMRWD